MGDGGGQNYFHPVTTALFALARASRRLAWQFSLEAPKPYSGTLFGQFSSDLGVCPSVRIQILEGLPGCNSDFGHGELRVYRGTGVSRGVRRTTWERSLKTWELQISCFEEFLGGENVLGLVPASLPHTLGYACTFYAPTSPPPMIFSP